MQVKAASAVGDPRLRYAVARRLAGLRTGIAVSELVRSLEAGRPVLRGVTLELAEASRAVLADAGLQALVEPGPERPPPLLGGARAMAALALVCCVGLGLGVWRLSDVASSPVRAASPLGIGSTPLTPKEVAARSIASVVTLKCRDRIGTGFFVSEGRLLTNEHVTCGPDVPMDVEMSDGTTGRARVLVSSARLDVALLESDDVRGKPLPLGSAGPLAAGDTLMVIGNPLGLASTFHVGSVSNPRRAILDVCYLQIDARVNPGNSGGPALDADGRVVGVVSLKHAGEGIGMALPIDYVYDGDEPVLEAPPGHPHAGFSEMLKAAERESARLAREGEQVGMRLVDARLQFGGRVLVVVVMLSTSTPDGSLEFQLESKAGRTRCEASADMRWQLSEPTDGFAARTRDWLSQKGLGEVYVGTGSPDFSSCSIDGDGRLELVLVGGDEDGDRVPLTAPH